MASLEATPVRDIISAPGARPPEDAQHPSSLTPGPAHPSSLIPHPSSLLQPLPSEAETRKDDFMGRAFKLASSLEDEFNKKIYFNADGLAEVEKKLRLTFIKDRQNPQEAVETVKNCAAFLCFLLQERFKGRLIKLPDFDHWGWPMVFDVPRHVITYPVERVWKLLWKGGVPEPGWLAKYLQYVEDELGSGKIEAPQGAAAVRGGTASHPERLTDARTEHRRIMILTATLEETAGIDLDRAGIMKLEKALKDKFKPDIPPTADGWKLLRCYGHILAEIAARDFKAAWYNTDGSDGFWSMRLPWGTFIFPIGKIYKTAANRESLGEYYDILLADKLRASNGGMG